MPHLFRLRPHPSYLCRLWKSEIDVPQRVALCDARLDGPTGRAGHLEDDILGKFQRIFSSLAVVQLVEGHYLAQKGGMG